MEIVAGECVSWGPVGNAATVRVTSAYSGSNSITYESSDGHSEIIFADMWRTLAEKTSSWRTATAEETAAFKRRYRPAPENWD